jgi:glutaminyl-peptide cyclotransferase
MKKFLVFLAIAATACNNDTDPGNGKDPEKDGPALISYSVVNTYPHDTSSFTEGLLFYKGELYESTGNYGKSKLLKVDLKTGKPLKSIALDDKTFGEGLVILNDTIYQLTYQQKLVLLYNMDFKKIGERPIASNEGWGLTTDGKSLIATDGGSSLFYYEPGTFKLLKTQDVTEAGSFSFNINELEYINGFIYANQWQSSYILKIDPATGLVVGKINMEEIANRIRVNHPYAEFLNGIAYDSSAKKIYVTGKWWPELYEIQLGQ